MPHSVCGASTLEVVPSHGLPMHAGIIWTYIMVHMAQEAIDIYEKLLTLLKQMARYFLCNKLLGKYGAAPLYV